ncbi:hypothetical protein IV102_17135 [bacterium]|nr:hypothetical protein [bacterium]
MLERVLVQDPGRTPAYLNLADALERLGREREAREHWQHYVELRRAQGLGIPDRVLKKLGSD